MSNRSRHGIGRGLRAVAVAVVALLASCVALSMQVAGADESGQRVAGTYDLLDADDEYVESLEIIDRQDGTAPWDSDDGDGDDSGDSNGRVRSYDYVSYTLQLSSSPYTEGVYYKSGYIRYRLVLPCDPSVAVFDTGAMSWMASGTGTDCDWHVETEEVDGRQCQSLYCSMYKTYDPHAFPCLRQTANVQIQIKNAPDGSTIVPTFYAWMDHNETGGTCATHGRDEVVSVTDPGVTVTSRESLNVQNVIDSARIAASDADFSTGSDDAPNKGAGKVHGAFFNIGNIVEMRNIGDQSRGLRGISVPDGSDIEYDVTLTPYYTTRSGTRTDAPDGTRVLLWNGGANATDNYGRGYSDETPVNAYCAMVPYGDTDTSRGTRTGTVTVTQDGNVLHVRVHGYRIDESKYPTQVFSSGNSASVYYDQRDYGRGSLYTNRGVFASSYESVCVTYDSSTLASYGGGSLSLSATVSNLTVGGVAMDDVVSTDDSASASYALGGKGAFDNRVWFCPYYGLNASDMYGNADRQNNSPYDTAVVGQKAMVVWGYTGSETEADYHYAVDSLVKFDASAIEPLDEAPRKYSPGGMNAVSDVVYAAKPDGTDWTGDDEKNAARIGDLVYYRTLADLKASGKACIGLLVSQRKGSTSYGWHWMTGIAYPVRVRDDDALIGTVASIVETSTYWSEDMISPKDAIPTFAETYFDGASAPTPTVSDYRRGNYVKSTYADGILTDTGNFNVGLGDSLYIMRYDIGVTKRIEQSDGTSEKMTYSLDNGESVVDYAVTPTCSRKVHWSADITITDTVPKGMEYDGDAVMGGTYAPSSAAGGHGTVTGGTSFPPTVTANDDGTTTLTWELKGFNLKNALPTIHYSCTVDKRAATNNQEYKNTVVAESTDDRRTPDESKGNVVSRTVKVVKLTSYSLSKRVDQETYELPEDIGWELAWNNTSRNSSSDTVMLDMMPYDGDGFGSSYHGTYGIASLTLKLDDGTSLSDYALYYTEDEAYRGKTTKDVSSADVTGSWVRADIGDDGTVPSIVGKSPVAWCVVGSLPANATLSASVRIATDGAKAGDSYVNGSSMMRTVVSSRATYLTRSVSGYAFVDAERNGYMDDVDKGLSGLTVTLHARGDATTPAKDTNGNDCVTVTDADGHYRFDDVPDGEYDVTFSGGAIGAYGLVSTTKDGEPGYNKASGIVTADDGTTESVTVEDATSRAVIGDRKDATSGVIYEREYSEVDAALFPTGELTVAKTDGTDPVAGATLVVRDANGNEADRWVTGDDGRHVLRLGKGSYTVSEEAVPDGYEAAQSVSFSVDGTGRVLDTDGNPMTAGEDGIVIEMIDARKPPLPATGMDGMVMASYVGAMALAVASIVMTAVRRHSAGSDGRR